jgi:predicted nucleic acid-binding Zn ribbon protein
MNRSLRARVLREWQPYAGENPTRADRTARPLEQLVPGVMQSLGLDQRLHESRLFTLWPELVGPTIAPHAQPTALRKGVLVVSVDQPTWLHELERYHKAAVLRNVQAAVGAATVRKIQFRIG